MAARLRQSLTPGGPVSLKIISDILSTPSSILENAASVSDTPSAVSAIFNVRRPIVAFRSWSAAPPSSWMFARRNHRYVECWALTARHLSRMPTTVSGQAPVARLRRLSNLPVGRWHACAPRVVDYVTRSVVSAALA